MLMLQVHLCTINFYTCTWCRFHWLREDKKNSRFTCRKYMYLHSFMHAICFGYCMLCHTWCHGLQHYYQWVAKMSNCWNAINISAVTIEINPIRPGLYTKNGTAIWYCQTLRMSIQKLQMTKSTCIMITKASVHLIIALHTCNMQLI